MDVYSTAYNVDRSLQGLFCRGLELLGFEGGCDEDPGLGVVDVDIVMGKSKHILHRGPGWTLVPYYWGDNPMMSALPNFLFERAGVAIWWYKRPLRAAKCNVVLTSTVLAELFEGIGVEAWDAAG